MTVVQETPEYLTGLDLIAAYWSAETEGKSAGDCQQAFDNLLDHCHEHQGLRAHADFRWCFRELDKLESPVSIQR